MSAKRRTTWRIAIAGLAMVAGTTTVALATAEPAHAAPGCQNGGVYVAWLRGSGQSPWRQQDTEPAEAKSFHDNVFSALTAAGITTRDWGEIGNLDGNFVVDTATEYLAAPVPWSVINGQYDASVLTGVKELIAHLNYRYTLGPVGMGCMSETAVLGGYSQGAEALGWALALTNGSLFGYPIPALTPEARNHIGFAALYGDPRFNVACYPAPNRQWVRANAGCDTKSRLQPPRSPYVPSDFLSRTGSWCDDGDGVCAMRNWLQEGNHTTAYRYQWIQQSASEIAAAARLKQCTLITTCSGSGTSAPQPPPAASNPYGAFDVASLVADQAMVRVQGWALDPNAGTGPITVHTYIDGAIVGTTTANTSRPDVGAAFPGFGNNHGFDAQYPISVGTHTVCTYAINVGAGTANPQLPSCRTIKKHDRIDELGIVRTNHGSGQTELSAWHGTPSYTTLYSSQLGGYPSISDPQNVKPIAMDTNGDGVDELGFVRFNHASGKTELSLWHGAPHYQTLLTTTLTGYPAITDPQNVTPIAIDTNGDGIDELGFVRSNYPGHAELSLWHGAPHYQTLLRTSITGYPQISDPQNVTPLAIDVNGDGVDELGFLRSNTSQAELSLWQGTNYTTYLPTPLTGYPNIGDPQNVTPIAIDVNGDRIDELAFVRTNHPAGTEISVWHGAPNYTTLYASQITGYPNISDPQNVTVLAMHLPS